MNVLNKFLSFLWRGWFVLLAFVATIIIGIFFILPFCFRDKDFPKAYFFCRVWAMFIFYGIGVRFRKHDFPDIEGSHPYVIIANHTSMLDVMLMLIINKKPMAFVGKKELTKMPIFGSLYKRLSVLVDRKDPLSRQKVIGLANQKMQQGSSICIFPEGRVPEREVLLDDFYDGAFRIAVLNKVPLITLSFCGLKEILPYAYFEGGPGVVDVYYHQTLETARLNKSHIPEIKQTCYDLMYEQVVRCEKRKTNI